MKNNGLHTLIMGFVVFWLSFSIQANHRPLGWHWYDEAKIKREAKNKSIHLPTFQTAKAALTFQQRIIEEAKAQAVIDPTPEHVRLYRILQEFVFYKAQRFGRVWQWVSLTDPLLDYTAEHPVASAALPLVQASLAKKLQASIQLLKQQFILTYVYRDQQALEKSFEETVKRFSTEYQWSLKEINLSDVTLVKKNGYQAMKRWLQDLSLPKLPALLLVDPATGQTYPLAFGFVTENEIEMHTQLWLREMQREKGRSD